MALTYDPIATTTLSSEAATITFSSIANSWTDLRLIMVGIKPSATNSAPMARFNSSSTGYSLCATWGNGISVTGDYFDTTQGGIPIIYFDGLNTTTPKIGIVDIFSYAGSTKKTVLCTENSDRGNGSGRVVKSVSMWSNTNAITSIDIIDGSGRNFGVGTTVTLYGIKKA
jgi:hypothetical protein